MIRRIDPDRTGPGGLGPDEDDRLGEAIETYLELVEEGAAPDPDDFAARYPDLRDDLRAALAGLVLVQGLVGESDHSGNPGAGARLSPGRTLAGYRIIRELGRGGMGVVYEALHVSLERPVALKVLSGDATPGSRGRRRFLNEAQTAASLHHTHIVPVFDFGQVGGICYYAMQRIDGAGLDRVLRALRRRATAGPGAITPANNAVTATWVRKTPPSLPPIGPPSPPPSHRDRGSDETMMALSPITPIRGDDGASGSVGIPPRRLDLAPPFDPPAHAPAYVRWATQAGIQAAEALAYAHEQGVIHRDVKPSNLLVDGKGNVWVADFGLARRLGDPSKTQSGAAVGTPKYMSPEQAAAKPLDHRTDIYSLGATLYELLTMRPPFEGATMAELSHQLTHKEPTPPRSLNPAIPRDLETIILKAMAKRPEDRYARAEDLADDLGRFLRHEPVKARRIGLFGRTWRLARRNPGTTAIAAAAALIVSTTVALAHLHTINQLDESRRREQKLQAETRSRISGQAQLLLSSAEPDRRERGLALLKEAAASDLGPAKPDLLAGLRTQALSFLATRDLRPGPTLDLGRWSGAALSGCGRRLEVLSADRAELRQWDIADGRRHPIIPLVHEQQDDHSRPWRWRGSLLTSVGNALLTPAVGGRGLQWVDQASGITGPIELEDRDFSDILASLDGTRLLSRDEPADPYGREQRSGDGPDDRPRPPRPPDNQRWSLWDVDDLDKPLATWSYFEEPGALRHVSLAPDGKTVVTAWILGESVEVWSGTDGRFLTDHDVQSPVLGLAAGPDGLFAVVFSGSIRVWRGQERAEVAPFALATRLAPVRILQFSPDGRLLAAAGSGGTEIWDVASGELIASLPQNGHIDDILFTPDGRTIAVLTDGQARFWTLNEPIGRATPLPLTTLPRSLAVREDGLLALSDSTAAIQLWTPRDPHGARKCAVPTEAAPMVAALPPQPPPPPPDHAPPPQGPGPRPGGPRRAEPMTLVAFDDRDRLLVADTHSMRVYDQYDREGKAEPHLLAEAPYYPDRHAPPGGEGFMVGAQSPDRTHWALFLHDAAWLWNGDDPGKLLRLRGPSRRGDADRPRGPFTLALGPSGEHLYMLAHSDLYGWRIEGEQLVPLSWSPLRGPEISQRLPEMSALAVSPDGRHLAIGDRRGAIALRDVASGEIVAQLASPREDQAEAEVSSLTFAPDGTLAAGTLDHVQLWSPTGEPLAHVPLSRGAITSLAFDDAGRFLAGSVHPGGRFRGGMTSGGSIVVWDLDSVRTTLRPLGLGW